MAETQQQLDAGNSALEKAREQLEGLDVLQRLETGDAAARIQQRAEADDIDMLVMGAAPKGGGFARQKSGFIRHLVGQKTLSVVVVRRAPQKLEHVLICTAGVEAGEHVIRRGADLAKKLGARATLLFVAGPVPSMYTGLAGIEEELSELLETDTPIARHLRKGAQILDEAGVDGDLELRHGAVAEQIFRNADENLADLIVLGASRVGDDLRGLLMGDVTQEIICGASHPVLIVK